MHVYNAIRKMKYSHPNAIHFIGCILACLIFEMMKHKKLSIRNFIANF